MKATILSYTLEKASPKERISLQRALYGYSDRSNNGNYKYNRKGIANSKGILKLNRGVIIVTDEQKKAIVKVLKKNKASIKAFNIDVESSIFN